MKSWKCRSALYFAVEAFVFALLLFLGLIVYDAVQPEPDPELLREDWRNGFDLGLDYIVPALLVTNVYLFLLLVRILWAIVRSPMRSGKPYCLLALLLPVGYALYWLLLRPFVLPMVGQ